MRTGRTYRLFRHGTGVLSLLHSQVPTGNEHHEDLRVALSLFNALASVYRNGSLMNSRRVSPHLVKKGLMQQWSSLHRARRHSGSTSEQGT